MTQELQDLAWKCLPKEYRDAIKERYSGWNRVIGFETECILYEETFGKHNLISDSKFKIGDLVRITKDCKYKGRIFTLYEYKYRPKTGKRVFIYCSDEKVYLTDDDIEHYTYKFKYGDIVRIKDIPNVYSLYRGEICKIIGTTNYGNYELSFIGGTWSEDSLELISTTDSNSHQ